MAGSKKWMTYENDAGQTFGVLIDESNGEAAGFDDYDGASPRLPQGYKMRYVNTREPVSGASRQIYVGKASNGLWTGALTSILLTLLNASGLATALTAFAVTSRVGERSAGATDYDTGLTDGDST